MKYFKDLYDKNKLMNFIFSKKQIIKSIKNKYDFSLKCNLLYKNTIDEKLFKNLNIKRIEFNFADRNTKTGLLYDEPIYWVFGVHNNNKIQYTGGIYYKELLKIINLKNL